MAACSLLPGAKCLHTKRRDANLNEVYAAEVLLGPSPQALAPADADADYVEAEAATGKSGSFISLQRQIANYVSFSMEGEFAPATNMVRLVTVKTLMNKTDVRDLDRPFTMCLLHRNDNMPWLRLALRLVGSESFNETVEGTVLAAVGRELSVASGDVGQMYASSPNTFKTVVVRDPVTRVLSSYLHTCRNNGAWDRCLSEDKAISFEELVHKLEVAEKSDLGPEFKTQMDMCALRSQPYDFVAHYERPLKESKLILEKQGLWEEYGKNGWGGLVRDSFGDIFVGDGTAQKVCQFYTPDLLERVHRIHRDDFTMLGYSVNTWHLRCAGKWANTSVDPAVDAVYKNALYSSGPANATSFLSGFTGPKTPSAVATLSSNALSPCVPSARELHALNADHVEKEVSQEAGSLLFFLHDSGPFDFSEVLDCFLTAHGVNLDDLGDGIDNNLYANVSEHLGEVLLVRALQRHSQRTHDPNEASVHILGILPFVSYAATLEDLNGACGDFDDHFLRMDNVRERLVGLPHFQLSGGRDFFVFSTNFRISSIYTTPLLDVMERSNIIVGTGDKDYNQWMPYPKIMRKIVLPYRAHHLVENDAWSVASTREPAVRNISFLFRGKITRSHEGSSRIVLKKVQEGLEALGHDNVEVADSVFFRYAPSFSGELAEAYKTSSFCFVPAGDTPTSRRLFDSLAAGCVPLALGNFEQLAENLPFRKSVDWTRSILFAGSLQCVGKDGGEQIQWMSDLTRTDPAAIRATAEAGRAVFRDYLSYQRNGLGVADAVLVELAYELGFPTVQTSSF